MSADLSRSFPIQLEAFVMKYAEAPALMQDVCNLLTTHHVSMVELRHAFDHLEEAFTTLMEAHQILVKRVTLLDALTENRATQGTLVCCTFCRAAL